MNPMEIEIKRRKRELIRIIAASVLAPLSAWALVLLSNTPDISDFVKTTSIFGAAFCTVVSIFFAIVFVATKCWWELFDDVKSLKKEMKDIGTRDRDVYVKDCKRNY